MTARFGPVASSYTVLPAPLLAYNFAESGTTATDRTGNGRTADLVVSSTLTDLHSSGQLLISQSGRRLRYTPDAAALPSFASVTVKVTTPSTLAGGGVGINLWSKFRAADSSGFNMYIAGTAINGVARGTTLVGPSICANTPPLVVNTTYQFAFTYDGTTARLYINGSQVDSKTTASGPLDMTGADTTWSIGDAPSDTSITPPTLNYFFDDVRFWNVALTAAQVAAAAVTPVS